MQAFISELSLDRSTMEDKSFEEGKMIMLLHTMHSALFNMHAAGTAVLVLMMMMMLNMKAMMMLLHSECHWMTTISTSPPTGAEVLTTTTARLLGWLYVRQVI